MTMKGTTKTTKLAKTANFTRIGLVPCPNDTKAFIRRVKSNFLWLILLNRCLTSYFFSETKPTGSIKKFFFR